jgi:Hypervirulence associated proteins TUDOR domain
LRAGPGPDLSARSRVDLKERQSGSVEHRVMTRKFKTGDHVRWNSEAGHVSGRIIAVHTKDIDYKGHTRHASQHDPVYEIKSDKTDHIAMHKGAVLHRIN